MRRFHLIHDPDDTNGAAAELIAEGVVFSDGTVALHWVNISTEITRQEPEQIINGDDWLEVVWLDDQPRHDRTARRLRVLTDRQAPHD
jgi:hypothetical protein